MDYRICFFLQQKVVVSSCYAFILKWIMLFPIKSQKIMVNCKGYLPICCSKETERFIILIDQH